MANHNRKSPRLKHFDYSSQGGYFITICTLNRMKAFGTITDKKVELSPAGKILEEEWLKSEQIRKEIFLDEYCIMPDHFHGIVFIHDGLGPQMPDWSHLFAPSTPGHENTFGPQYKSLSNLVGQFKGAVTRRVKTTVDPNFDWQERYNDRIIRDEAECDRIRLYIKNNPGNWKEGEEDNWH